MNEPQQHNSSHPLEGYEWRFAATKDGARAMILCDPSISTSANILGATHKRPNGTWMWTCWGKKRDPCETRIGSEPSRVLAMIAVERDLIRHG